MVDTAVGSRAGDLNNSAIMLADSRTAANNFGFHGSQFLDAPKSKFLFYVKFHSNVANTSWGKTIGAVVKSVDRPRIQFKTETLNQYNRKRVVQTTQEFEPIQLKFHDSMSDSVQSMFVDYYRFYYSNTYMESAGTSVYDVVTGEANNVGRWGFRPPLVDVEYAHYFTHISVYQLYSGFYNQFDLVNPKIRDFNPDEFDSAANGSAEIQMSFEYENIIFQDTQRITDDLIAEMGLDRAQYWNVDTTEYNGATYGLVKGDPSGNLGNAVGNVLGQNLASIVTGQGSQGLGGALVSVAGQFDANRGLAVGKTAVTSLKNIVSGNTGAGKQGIQGLLKGTLFGSPGKFF